MGVLLLSHSWNPHLLAQCALKFDLLCPNICMRWGLSPNIILHIPTLISRKILFGRSGTKKIKESRHPKWRENAYRCSHSYIYNHNYNYRLDLLFRGMSYQRGRVYPGKSWIFSSRFPGNFSLYYSNFRFHGNSRVPRKKNKREIGNPNQRGVGKTRYFPTLCTVIAATTVLFAFIGLNKLY